MFDPFHTREVESLRDRLELLTLENARLKDTVDKLTAEIDATPADCVRGPWCASCSFGKATAVLKGLHLMPTPTTVFTCGRADACKHHTPPMEMETV